jgi:site-specific DNA recombinase
MNLLKAVIYTRVSTERQADEGTSLEVQETACLKKAQEMGAQVVDIVSDEGISGAFFLSRPGIQKVLSIIECGEANLLITMKLDRTGRDVDVIRMIQKRVTNAGGRLVFTDGMTFENTATGRFMLTQFSAVAELEKEVIRERMMSGKRKRAEQGQQPSRTQPPFGYHVVLREDVIRGDYTASELGKYQIIEKQAVIVRELFRRCAAGATLRQLARWMQEQGVPTQRGGKAWYGSTLRYLLMNPAYKGTPYWGRNQWRTDESRIAAGKKPAHSRKAPASDWVTLECEPLVDTVLWEQCQERLAENQQVQSGPTKRRYLLSGLIRCPKCGRAMRSMNSKRGGLYYTCVEGSPGRSYSGRICLNKTHRADVVEPLLLHTLTTLSSRPELFRNALRAYYLKHQQSRMDDTLRQALSRELDGLTKREQATATAQVQAIAQGRDTAVYDRLLADIDTRRRTVQSQLKTMETGAPLRSEADFESDGERVSEVLRRTHTVLAADELNAAEKFQVVSTVIKSIRPDDNGYLFEMRSSSLGSQVASSVQMISIHCPPGASK